MDIILIAGFCITAVVICKVVEKDSREIKTVLTLAAVCIILLKTAGAVTGISSSISDLFNQAGMDTMYLKIIFKGLGICYLTQFACDFSKDCGENALASQVELAGKIALLIVSLPLFNALIEIVKTLLK